MKNKRKINRIWKVALLMIAFSGCGMLGKQNPIVTPPAVSNTGIPTQIPEAEKAKGYLFVYGTTEIAMDMEAEEVQRTLGDVQTYFEAPSCAVEGMIRTYGYGSFEMDTYEIEGKEYIAGIYFKDDTVSTQEGAYLFMTEAQLFSIYGTSYTEETGFVVYEKDGMKLKFLLKAGEVISIQYSSGVSDVE